MATGGLSRTDFGKKEVIGGYALEFYWRVGRKYGIQRFAQDVVWFYEPKAGEQVLREMLEQAGVRVLMRHRLREKTGVEKSGTKLASIETGNGARFAGRMFADCSYEGDLMAQSGVRYTIGRESQAEYGESLAGVRERTPLHQFLARVSPYDANGKLLAEVDSGPRGAPGSADKKVQAYNFRMILSEDPANQAAFPKPPDYNPKRYEVLARLLDAMTAKLGRAPVMQEVTLTARRTSTIKARFPPIISARAGATRMATMPPARASGKTMSTTSRASSIFWPTTLAFQPRCKTRSTPGDLPGTNSSTRRIGRINYISARPAAWSANLWLRRRTSRPTSRNRTRSGWGHTTAIHIISNGWRRRMARWRMKATCRWP